MHPTSIGRYKIESEIGRGGMATVYQAYDPNFERRVAIKLLPHALLHDPQFRQRFEREAKMIALLEHPSIVPVYDFGEQDGQPFIVMRYMSGGSLKHRLESGSLPINETMGIIRRLAQALDAAHAKGIVHRDLKPGNILFDQYGNAFLSDFGIARLSEQAGATLTGDTIVGTPAYMSPEQIKGDYAVDGRSDIYALGIIIFQMLTGEVPFRGETPTQTMMMHVLEPVPSILDKSPGLSPGYGRVIEKALAKEPQARFATATQLVDLMEAAARDEQPAAQSRYADETIVAHRGVKARSQAIEQPAPLTGKSTTASQRRAISPWIILGIGLGLVGLVGVGLIGGLFFMGRQGSGPLAILNQPTPTQISSSAVASFATVTLAPPPTARHSPVPSPTAELIAVMSPTSVVPVLIQATDTPEPTATATQVPSETPTQIPSLPVIGGADMVAFVNDNNIWVANIDGTGLTQLTSDGAAKSNLQWTPDGSAVNFILGKCVQSVDIETAEVTILSCFEAADHLEAFEISPDGNQVAISLNRELFIVPYDLARLGQARFRRDLVTMAGCEHLGPYTRNAVKSVRWSKDGQRLAVVILGVSAGKQVDLVHLLDISKCVSPIPRIDEFPAQRFTMEGYEVSPYLQNITWDGDFLFALFSFKRNGGFGDLHIYNADLHKAELINPISKVCCYRDPQWSPDGRFLLFAFQDMRLAPKSVIKLYYVPFGTIGTGLNYAPLPLPDDFFADARSMPLPALRPAK